LDCGCSWNGDWRWLLPNCGVYDHASIDWIVGISTFR
jgi:hypothetical protein